MKKMAVALALALTLTSGAAAVPSVQAEAAGTAADVMGTGPAVRTKAEVANRYEELMPTLFKPVTYDEEPSVSAPYSAGKVSDDILQEGVDALNLVRYVAGLSDNVVLDDGYTETVQHTAVLLAAINSLSHTPPRPADMDDAFYREAYAGAGSSNLAAYWGLAMTPASSVITQYMDDSDDSNISAVGHRRWVLNPDMGKTGFGFAQNASGGRFSAMYAFDRSGSSDVEYVTWPAQVTPYELYQYTPAFSISLDTSYRVAADAEVTVHSQMENEDYVFSSVASDGQYYTNSGGYGLYGTTIIFMPEVNDEPYSFGEGDVLTVSVDGISKDGQEIPFEYTVDLFSVEDEIEDLDKTVSSIEVSGPGKIQYIEGEEFSLEGGTVNVTYSNGDTEQVVLTENMLAAKPDMTKIGEQTVTVNYGGKSTTFTINIRAKQLQDTVLTAPEKTDYYAGEALDLTGGKLLLVYDNGTSETIDLTSDMVSGYDSSKTGEQTVTVSYGGMTETFTVTVQARQVTEISWESLPEKTAYVEGQELDLTGAYVTVSYNVGDDETIAVTADMVSGYDPSKVGTQTVTVTVGGQSISFRVEVSAKAVTGIRMAANPTKMEYIVGQTFDISGAQIELTYNDGERTIIPVTEDMFQAPDMTTVGEKTVTVSYGGFETEFTVKVRDKQATGIEMNTLPDQTEYLENKVGQEFSAEGGSVSVLFDNGTKETVPLTEAMCSVDLTTAGEQTVTVTYNGFTTSFTVTVNAKSIESVKWAEEPTIVEVKEGTELAVSGTVLVTYDNGRNEEIELTAENAEVVGYDPETVGTQNITIALKDYVLSAEMQEALVYEVQVLAKEAAGIRIDSLPKTEYTVGDKLSLEGLEVSLVYDNGTSEKIAVEDVEISTPDLTSAGTKDVVVSYRVDDETVFEASFEVVVKEKTEEPSGGDGTQTPGGSTGTAPEDGKGQGQKPAENRAADTGDDAGYGIWAALMTAALFTAAAAAAVRKKNGR